MLFPSKRNVSIGTLQELLVTQVDRCHRFVS